MSVGADGTSKLRFPPIEPWTAFELGVLVALAAFGFALRAHALSAEGFADDEIHKWLAASRYLRGDFGGDDVEHPMLMKSLIALCIAILPSSWAPETLTRIPNVLLATATVFPLAQLGRRLYGKPVALLACGILTLSATSVGYARIAKEDTGFTLFFVAVFWCLAEARAAADAADPASQGKWELRGGALLGVMLAAKYQIFVIPMYPILYFVLRPGSAWRVPLRRWVQLSAVGVAALLVLNWAILMPSTWTYLFQYSTGQHVGGDRSTSETLLFMGRLWGNMPTHVLTDPPWWFFFAFLAVKLAVPSVILGAAGLALALARRSAADRLVLVWIGFLTLVYFVMATKYARYAIPLVPAFALLAGESARAMLAGLRLSPRWLALVAALVWVPEAYAAVQHEPHPRLFINALGGGDAKVDFWFPHCDYFDAGVREAVRAIAAQAGPNAEIATETRWPVRWYADQAGRPDLQDTSIRPGDGCTSGRVCYVIVQSGRRYGHNAAAVDALEKTAPWTTVEVAGHVPIRIYRLEPRVRLFPE